MPTMDQMQTMWERQPMSPSPPYHWTVSEGEMTQLENMLLERLPRHARRVLTRNTKLDRNMLRCMAEMTHPALLREQDPAVFANIGVPAPTNLEEALDAVAALIARTIDFSQET